jgi:dienelactone hydrolase
VTRSTGKRPSGAACVAAAWCVAALTVSARAGENTTVPASAALPAIPAYIAQPAAAGARPAILILHGCEGYSRRYARIADQFALHGYVAVAIDTLRPRGVRNACQESSASRLEAEYARATLAWMRNRPEVDDTRLALLGYSMGAIATLDLVDPQHPSTPPAGVRAAVAYYPACRNRTAANLRTPLLILIGTADDWTPAAPCRDLAAAGARLGAPVTIVQYQDATHAFNVARPARVAYGHHLQFDAAAALDAERQSLTFLDRYLGGP